VKIQVLGPGCKRCKELMANTEQAVRELGLGASVEKVEDVREMMKFKILATPALAVDGQVRAAGRVLSPKEVKQLLQA